MTGPTDFGLLDPPRDWVVCFECKGEALVTTCLAEPCPHEPPCPRRRCRVCGGEAGWRRADVSPSTRAQDEGQRTEDR